MERANLMDFENLMSQRVPRTDTVSWPGSGTQQSGHTDHRTRSLQTTMPRNFTVPKHLQQPLHIETDITYDLDKSKFPGLDDPEQMYEPALLIAQDTRIGSYWGSVGVHSGQPVVMSEQSKPERSTHVKRQCYEQSQQPKDKDVLEELLNIIDSCNGQLLGRLSGESKPQQSHIPNMYKSIADACGYDTTPTTSTASSAYRSRSMQSVNTYHQPRPVLRDINSMNPGNFTTSQKNCVQGPVLGNATGHYAQNVSLPGYPQVMPMRNGHSRDVSSFSSQNIPPSNYNINFNSSVQRSVQDHASLVPKTSIQQLQSARIEHHVASSRVNMCDMSSMGQYYGSTQNDLHVQSQRLLKNGLYNCDNVSGYKRKRSSDLSDVPLVKRQCYFTDYTNSLSVFNETNTHRRSLMV